MKRGSFQEFAQILRFDRLDCAKRAVPTGLSVTRFIFLPRQELEFQGVSGIEWLPASAAQRSDSILAFSVKPCLR